jgi:hypothetical protein
LHETRSRKVWFVLVFGYVSLITIPGAHAYIDPGSGSFIFQVLVGGLLAAGVVFRSFWKRLWSFFSRRNPRDGPSSRMD